MTEQRWTLRVVNATGTLVRELPPGSRLVIGRSRSCDVALADDRVSREHVLVTVDSRVVLEDLGSANGTRLLHAGRAPATDPETVLTAEESSQRLAPREPIELEPGSTFQIGSTLLTVGLSDSPHFREVVLVDAAMVELYAKAARVAQSPLSVLILGETGVGKEHLAEFIAKGSSRRDRPFVRLNCAAFADSLLEAELFGYERGAFTGAVRTKPGLLETAAGGSVFLDEVGELSLPTQAKLLRALEAREIVRVGGLGPIHIDVRFVSATNKKLEAEIAAGRFREDLYFRLNGVELVIPPLRERKSEIPALARELLRRAAELTGRPLASLDSSALAALEVYPWPGNVRELKSVLERASLFCDSSKIGAGDLELPRGDARRPSLAPASPDGVGELRDRVLEVERDHILAVLDECGGNQTAAARRLGISRTTLSQRLDAFGVRRPRKGR
ncbi:MAG: sigma 54-interacting transcriptional regulator [Polyangiaceae bacterium]